MNTVEDTSTARALSPKWIPLEDNDLAEEARKHIRKNLKKKTPWFPCRAGGWTDLKARQDSTEAAAFDRVSEVQAQLTIGDSLNIEFGDNRTNKNSECTSDQTKWVILYENQRGFMLFSTPYYSGRSLLPRDPPAFTAPESTPSSIHHVSRNATLNTYPMPDPTWTWFSDKWYVDMRGDGEVQHDGRGGWRPKVGWFSAGGFVRRRRWIRMMFRPSDAHLEAEAKAKQREFEDRVGESLMLTYISEDVPLWKGDQYDWHRLHKLLKKIARDGPKIELWKAWLTDLIEERGSHKNKFREVSEDYIVMATNENHRLSSERPCREWVVSILKEHGRDFRHFFVFSQSRMQFGALLLEAGILQELVPDAPNDEVRIATKRLFSGPPILRKYPLKESYPRKLFKSETSQKRLHSAQALIRKPTRKTVNTTVSSQMDGIPLFRSQGLDLDLEEDISKNIYDLAYISSLYYPGDAYVTQKDIDNPKSIVWGLPRKERTVYHTPYNKDGITYNRWVISPFVSTGYLLPTRCTVYIGNSIVAIGDSLTKVEAEQLAALSAYFQLIRRRMLPIPSSPKALESRLPAFLKSRGPSIRNPETSIRLPDNSELTYERARSFMEYYCDRFRLGRQDISFESLDARKGGSWRAVIGVSGRRIGIGLGSNKKNAQVAAYFDVVTYLNQCDAGLWSKFLEAEKNGLDLGLASKVSFNMSRALHKEVDALCRDIRGSTLYRNRPINQGTSSQEIHSFSITHSARPARSPQYFNAKSEILKNRLVVYKSDPAYASLRNQRESLPVAKQAQSILSQVASNDVTICMAATGSGKTTQIPQLILDEAIERGEGAYCNIICTQPRRIAAISVAQRVANERGENIGSRSSIGYQARFESKPPDDHGSITFCTIGVLLKRLQNYFASPEAEEFRNLDNVTHIVVDEVHERDVDTDLLLVVLKRFLEHRRSRNKPLKILLMSATIDSTLFQEYFRDARGQLAPVIEVPGRSFPVNKYFLDDTIQDLQKNKVAQWVFGQPSVIKFLDRELGEEVDMDSERDDVLEIPYPLVALTIAHVLQKSDSGHVLVFLPGWEDISTVQRHLLDKSRPLGLDFNDSNRYSIHLLHSTIPLQDQQVIFEPPPPGVRRIILATNIAETSVTIPDVVYVVDTAKIKENRYDPQRYMSYLVTAWVGSSNLNQRAGRAGRHRSGEYFGILSKARADSLSPYQMVEMKRADLSNVVMHIKALNFPSMGLHEVLAAAIEPPDPHRVVIAIQQLQQIGALDDNENLTPLGKILLHIPVDVQIGRLLLYGAFFRCLDKALALAAILSNRDPFLSPPLLKREAQAVKHSWSPPGVKSDVLAILSAYEAWGNLCGQGDYNKANRFCMDNFLSKNTLHAIDRLKGHLLQALYNVGVIDVSAGGDLATLAATRIYIPPQLMVNSQSLPLLSALVTLALQPKYAIQSSERVYRTIKDKITIIHPSSINSSRLNDPDEEPFQERQIIAFTEQRQNITVGLGNPAPSLVGTSRIEALHYILFGAYHLRATRQGLECDGWVPIVAPQDTLDSIHQLRTLTDQCMLRVYEGISHSGRKHHIKGTSVTAPVDDFKENPGSNRHSPIRNYQLNATEVQELDFLTRDLVRILDKFNHERRNISSGRRASSKSSYNSFLDDFDLEQDNLGACESTFPVRLVYRD
ncbi:hypothetical protein Clacol_003916 [Clathrus columnatus]|uniref:P-loop containing nucleoside triphosphate hydrolase protein n=1 Tax=Clathrus columnatus TaxID=1419009 RepID=A0AAV5A530_9AGAM|nr:hypothetical protein Clacol_003916 [Clathrus columnatus]